MNLYKQNLYQSNVFFAMANPVVLSTINVHFIFLDFWVNGKKVAWYPPLRWENIEPSTNMLLNFFLKTQDILHKIVLFDFQWSVIAGRFAVLLFQNKMKTLYLFCCSWIMSKLKI